MKFCPKCSETFSDETLRFCLTDGTQLRDLANPPTVLMPTEVSTPTAVIPRTGNNRRAIFWIMGALAFLAIGGVLVAALVVYAYRLGRESAREERMQNANTLVPHVTPSRSASPAPTRSMNETTPETSPADTDSDIDEVTSISWTTAAVGFKKDIGQTYRFHCPEKGTPGVIWGSDIYTADSSICTAAVHAGVITLEEGGDVTIEFKPGRSIYGSTTRNGITSNTFGEYPNSFVVRETKTSGLAQPMSLLMMNLRMP